MASLFRPKYTKDGVTRRLAKWYARGVPGWPKGKKVPLSEDKALAQQMLADLVRQALQRQAGARDRLAEQALRPLGDHPADYVAALRQ